MKINAYQVFAVLGSTLLMVSGYLRFTNSGSPKELIIAALYFLANVIIFCL
jgi:hypothetical protein